MLKEPPDQRKRKATARQVRRGSALRRIEEYERFEVHCNNIKKLEKEKREKKCQDILTIHSNLAEPEDVDEDRDTSVPIVEVEILWLVLKCKCKIVYRKSSRIVRIGYRSGENRKLLTTFYTCMEMTSVPCRREQG